MTNRRKRYFVCCLLVLEQKASRVQAWLKPHALSSVPVLLTARAAVLFYGANAALETFICSRCCTCAWTRIRIGYFKERASEEDFSPLFFPPFCTISHCLWNKADCFHRCTGRVQVKYLALFQKCVNNYPHAARARSGSFDWTLLKGFSSGAPLNHGRELQHTGSPTLPGPGGARSDRHGRQEASSWGFALLSCTHRFHKSLLFHLGRFSSPAQGHAEAPVLWSLLRHLPTDLRSFQDQAPVFLVKGMLQSRGRLFNLVN